MFLYQCRSWSRANQALVAKTGAQEYAPHVINTPLAFLIKSAFEHQYLWCEPGWQGTGWRAGRDLQRRDIGGGKPGPLTVRKMRGSRVTVRAL